MTNIWNKNVTNGKTRHSACTRALCYSFVPAQLFSVCKDVKVLTQSSCTIYSMTSVSLQQRDINTWFGAEDWRETGSFTCFEHEFEE